jgi:hypothetical protein
MNKNELIKLLQNIQKELLTKGNVIDKVKTVGVIGLTIKMLYYDEAVLIEKRGK